jgi:hypothetical protein
LKESAKPRDKDEDFDVKFDIFGGIVFEEVESNEEDDECLE